MAVADFRALLAAIREFHREYGWFYRLIGGLVLVLFGVWLGARLFAEDDGYQTNLYTELLSIAVTVFILNELAKRRETRQLREQLVHNASSASNEVARDAVHQIRRLSWHRGRRGLLKGQDLSGANLSGAEFYNTNLSGAWLSTTDLSDTIMSGADLSNADLADANLRGAHLESANLSGAGLLGANLSGAKLSAADLTNAHFDDTLFDETTQLPDRTMWSLDTDMERFTNPQHPHYWTPPQW